MSFYDLSDLEIFRKIHEWGYTSHLRFEYKSFVEFTDIAKYNWNDNIIDKYYQWVIDNMYLFPWHNQANIHRIGGFSWELITNENQEQNTRKSPRSKSSPRLQYH